MLLAAGTAAAAMLVFALGRSRLATAVKSILAFWLIVMTYLGVNYLLGTGLHSYGFGQGKVAMHLLAIGGVDAVAVLASAAVALARGAGRAEQAEEDAQAIDGT